MIKICEQCGKIFETHNEKKLYHNKRCKKVADEWRMSIFRKDSDRYKKYRKRRTAATKKLREKWKSAGLCGRCGRVRDRYKLDGSLAKQCSVCYSQLKGEF